MKTYVEITQHMFVTYLVGHGLRLEPRCRVTQWLDLACIFIATGYHFQGQKQEDQLSP